LKPNGILSWNLEEISSALKISTADVKQYFTDGRKVSFIIERRLCSEIFNGQMAPTEGASYDLIDSYGKKWEVRSISDSGIYFCPSYMVGSGRKFDTPGFLSKISEIDGYILSDITQFPNIPFWIINKDTVLNWWNNNELGINSKVSKSKILSLLSTLK